MISTDLGKAELRKEFQEGDGLIRTDMGWRVPDDVFAGPSVFGQYQAFAPPVPETKSLWNMLQLKKPSMSDCIQILQKIARRNCPLGVDDESIQIKTFRLLAVLVPARLGRKERRKLAKLRLWTSQGWKRNRPIFVTEDESVADGLADQLPIWKPGGELSQFQSLIEPLRVEVIRSSDAEVIAPENAQFDAEASELFREAVRQLQEDFVRNDPELAQGLDMGWEALSEFQVSVYPELTLSMQVPSRGPGRALNCSVSVRIDPSRRTVFVRDLYNNLPRADCGGRALAALFTGNRRRVAHAWRTAWDLAESGRTAISLELAEQRDEREREDIGAEIGKLLEGIKGRTGSSHRPNCRNGERSPAPTGEPPSTDLPKTEGTNPVEPRELVNPASLTVVDPEVQVAGGSAARGRQQPPDDGLTEPHGASPGPQNRAQVRRYSDVDRENVGFELARKVLSSDHNKIVDLRTQFGVGADAMDEFRNFYELKVHAGAEPNSVSLTKPELQRARNSSDFFLVIVSQVEEKADSKPIVRIIPRPLDQLEQSIPEKTTLSGIRDAKSLVYNFVRRDEPVEGENTDESAVASE